MKNFIMIDYLIENVKKLYSIIKSHKHEEYITKEELPNFVSHRNVISKDLRIDEGNNAVFSGPVEIKGNSVLEIPKGCNVTII